LNLIDLGQVDYVSTVETMKNTLADRIADRIGDTLIVCEHDPVFTVGRNRGAEANILTAGDVPVVNVTRGGDVTFHGPGQLVGYPILALPPHRHDLHGYLRGLEKIIIRTLKHFGLTGHRDVRNTGVWVEGKKVAAIGIAARKWVTWHGFALNLTTDLSYYQQINPCGLDSTLVTRLADHLMPCPDRDQVITVVTEELTTWWEDWTASNG